MVDKNGVDENGVVTDPVNAESAGAEGVVGESTRDGDGGVEDVDDEPARYSSAVRRAAQLIRRRWMMDILVVLAAEGERRNSEIMAAVPGIGDKTLAGALAQAVEDGLIRRTPIRSRQVGDPNAGVWYEITPMGRSLLRVLRPLAEWALEWEGSLPPLKE